MSEFKEVPLKRPERFTGIPACLLPVIPSSPVIMNPTWLSPLPKIFKLKSGLAITLDNLFWRDALGQLWVCRKGFLTDGASVPWVLRWLWSRWDESTLRPAIIHDMRYSLHDYFKDWHKYDNQKMADRSLLDGMKIDCPSRAHKYYIGVRLFGRSVYEHINEEKLMLEWIDVLREDSEEALDAWILGVINADKAA